MVQASHSVVERLRNEILTGSLQQGSWLREEELSDRLGVSRTPVREALRLLAAEGIVEVLPRRGARVVTWSIGDIAEMYDLRVMLESHAASRAATRIRPEGIAELVNYCERMEALVDQEQLHAERLGELNSEFHECIVAAANSPRLTVLLQTVVHMPLVMRTFHRYDVGQRRRSMNHHRELTHAFAARDGEWAAAVMRTHILAARSALIDASAQPPRVVGD